jgi:hypothetical protein
MDRPTEIERPDEDWKYPYVAAVVDFGANFQMSVAKAGSRAVGYSITPSIIIQNTNSTAIGFLDEFCENHDLDPRLKEKEYNYSIQIARRDDLKTFLRLVEPFIIARTEPVRILLKNLLPGLQMGKQSDEEGFIQLMGHVDEIRKHTTQRSEPKYTQDYFRDEFGR